MHNDDQGETYPLGAVRIVDFTVMMHGPHATQMLADLGAEVYPWLPVDRLLRHRHEVIESLPQVRVPTLIAHSRQDEIVSFDHARRLMDVAHDGAVLLEMEGGHNDGFLRTGQRYVRGLGDFLEEHVFRELP